MKIFSFGKHFWSKNKIVCFLGDSFKNKCQPFKCVSERGKFFRRRVLGLFVVLEKQQPLFNRNFSSQGKAIFHSNDVWEENVHPALLPGAPVHTSAVAGVLLSPCPALGPKPGAKGGCGARRVRGDAGPVMAPGEQGKLLLLPLPPTPPRSS